MRKLIVFLLLSLPFAAMAQVDLKSRWIVNLNGFRFTLHNAGDSIFRVRTDSILFGKPTNLALGVSQSTLNDSTAALRTAIAAGGGNPADQIHDSLTANIREVVGANGIEVVDGGGSGVDTIKSKSAYTGQIDLGGADYTITKMGNYKIVDAGGGTYGLAFPDYTLFPGGTITIWNPPGGSATISAGTVIDAAGGGVTSLTDNTIYIFKSTFDGWLAGKLN